MTVLVVETGITYADGTAALAALPNDQKYTLKLSGDNAFSSTVGAAQFPFGLLIIPADGEGVTNDGDINIGAKITGTLSATAPNLEIRDLRTNRLILTSAPDSKLRRLIMDGLGSDALTFNDTTDAKDIIIHNADDGVISSALRPNSLMFNITVVDAGRFGFANGKFNYCVDIDSANQGFFNERAGSAELWENDGTGTNSITESPATDALVDYAAGKYGLKADSSPALSGAGAFISVESGAVDLVFLESTVQATIDTVSVANIISLGISDTILSITSDTIIVENITTLSIADSEVNVTADSVVIESLTSVSLLDSAVSPATDSIVIKNLSGISLLDNLVTPTIDSLVIEGLSQLSFTSASAVPLIDTITIGINTPVVDDIVIADTTLNPSIDTIAVQLYTELEFSNLSVRTTIDTILISTGVMPDFGNNDLLLIDNTASYLLVDNTTDYRIT